MKQVQSLLGLVALSTLSAFSGCATPGGQPPPFESAMSFRLMLYG